ECTPEPHRADGVHETNEAPRRQVSAINGTIAFVPGPSPATVASANRFSRVAEGLLNHQMLSQGKRRSAEYERDNVRLSSLSRQHLPLRRQCALCRRNVRKLPGQS